MKERLVKGAHVRSVVQVLRVHERSHPLPQLGVWERDLLRKHVAPSTWYALKVFDSLLQVVHRYVLDGSETAGQTMGRRFVRTLVDDTRELTIVPLDPTQSLSQLAERWPFHFNFGSVVVTKLPQAGSRDAVRMRISGYPDMSATHGHAIIGFALETVERCGSPSPELHVEERPWMHNNVLSFTLTWDSAA